jgi:hypothetical protein
VKSYFLIGITRPEKTRQALSRILPGQTDPWLLLATADDPIAYFYIESEREIHVSVSGRHFNEDAKVLEVLERLSVEIGGAAEDDFMDLFVLDKIENSDLTQRAPDELLPGLTNPWVLFDTPGKPIAYLSIESPTQIWAWVSSRHSTKPAEAIKLLKRLQSALGGIVTDYNDRPVD